jgi:hypothetical protein
MIRIINKIIVVLLLMLALPIVTLSTTMPSLSRVLFQQAFKGLDFNLSRLTGLATSQQLTAYAITAGIDIIILILLYAQLRRPPRDQARIRMVGGGLAEISFQAIGEHIKDQVTTLPEVLDAKPRVTAAHRRVKIFLDVSISPNIENIPNTASAIIAVVRETVEQKMGLTLAGKPRIRIRHASKLSRALQPPPPPPTPTPQKTHPPTSVEW